MNAFPRRSMLCVFVLVLLLGTAGHGAIYYINDGGQTNATGSTFTTVGALAWKAASVNTHPAYGHDYTYSNGGDATGTFTFAGPTDSYYVYAGWSPPNDPASRTQDGTITVNGVSDTIVSYPVNHEKRADGSPGANYTGSGFFPVQSGAVQQPITLGAGSTIVYSDGTETPPGDRISADVVVLSTDLLIDDISALTDAGAAYTIKWDTATNHLGEYSYGYHYAASPGGDIFEYDLGAALGAGPAQAKELKASWMGDTDRDQSVTYRITHTAGTTDVTVNQRQDAAGDTLSGTEWSDFRSLGVYQFDASSKVELIAGGGDTTSADTIALASAPDWDIAAHFNDGNTAAKVDGYLGKAGDGWTGAWQLTHGSAAVATADPLGDPGDPYLSVGSYSGDRLVRRQYEAYGDLDPARPHRIRWSWRFDGSFAGTANQNERIHFFAQDNAHTGSGADNSWLIGWVRADGDYDIHEGNWYFFDGSAGTGFGKGNMVDTGLGLTAGMVYDFEVVVDPSAGTYDAWISDGTNSFAARDLTFRNQDTGAYTWLHFGGVGGSGDDTSFSLDSLELQNVPEPATVGLLLGGLAALMRRRRRR